MTEFTPLQPRDGDVILHCGHFEAIAQGPAHWYSRETDFIRPDLSTGSSKWMVLCPDCQINCQTTGVFPDVHGDSIWKGDEPVIRAPLGGG